MEWRRAWALLTSGRFVGLCGAAGVTPAVVGSLAIHAMRSVGLSERKASYIQDLAANFSDGRLTDELLHTAADDELSSALLAVRGVGLSTTIFAFLFPAFRLVHSLRQAT
jgi:DNA-3-methyladenine glycosylase II